MIRLRSLCIAWRLPGMLARLSIRLALSRSMRADFYRRRVGRSTKRSPFDQTGITSRDWETYPILRFDNIPEIETVMIDRPNERFLGAGEAVSGPTAGAIANAIHMATGLRMRRSALYA